MNLHLKLNLKKIYDEIDAQNTFYVTFDNISNLSGWNDNLAPYPSSEVTKFILTWDATDLFLDVYSGNNDAEIGGTLFYQLASNELSISFDCDVNMSTDLLYLIESGFVDINVDGKTSMIGFRLNTDKDHLTKSLTAVTIIQGTFKAPLGVKTLELDVVNYDINNSYNYVYIDVLKRYYYVTNPVLVTKDHTKLILQEDVLMTWRTLIKSQNAFVTRYGGATNKLLVDDRYPLNDEVSVSYITPVPSSGATIKSFKLVMDNESGLTIKKPNIFMKVTSRVSRLTSDSDNVTAPSGSGLPNIQSRRNASERQYLINKTTLSYIISASINNNAPASYIHSLLLLPFDLTDIFSSVSGQNIYVGDKALIDGATWGNASDISSSSPTAYLTDTGGSPYICVADFSFNDNGGISLDGSYLDYSPATQWEIYIPFVGWIPLDPATVINKRIQVYFTFDLDTGLSTCFIYNYTNQKVIWSGSCQIGLKLTLAVTNAEELARQKNATTLNLIMGLLTGSVSTVIGAKTGSGSSVGSGLTGMVNSVTSAVNSYNSLIEKAQITFGSSDNALYNPMEVIVRKTTHATVISGIDEYNRFVTLNGKPYKKYVQLSSLTTGNYIEVGEIHFDFKSYNIYSDEVSEIIALLKNGVIL